MPTRYRRDAAEPKKAGIATSSRVTLLRRQLSYGSSAVRSERIAKYQYRTWRITTCWFVAAYSHPILNSKVSMLHQSQIASCIIQSSREGDRRKRGLHSSNVAGPATSLLGPTRCSRRGESGHMTCTDDCAAVAETTEACGGATAGLLPYKSMDRILRKHRGVHLPWYLCTSVMPCLDLSDRENANANAYASYLETYGLIECRRKQQKRWYCFQPWDFNPPGTRTQPRRGCAS